MLVNLNGFYQIVRKVNLNIVKPPNQPKFYWVCAKITLQPHQQQQL